MFQILLISFFTYAEIIFHADFKSKEFSGDCLHTVSEKLNMNFIFSLCCLNKKGMVNMIMKQLLGNMWMEHMQLVDLFVRHFSCRYKIKELSSVYLKNTAGKVNYTYQKSNLL